MDKSNFVKILSSVSILVGILVIIGWIFDITLLKSVLPNFVSMKFIAALSFVLSGIILYLFAKIDDPNGSLYGIILPGASALLAILMVSSLLSSLTNNFAGFENFFVKEDNLSIDTVAPGRPSLLTIVDFLLISFLGFWPLINFSQKKKIMRYVGCTILLSGSVAMLGHIIGSPLLYFYFEGVSSGMALHTAALFVLLGAGFYMISGIKENFLSKKNKLSIKSKILLGFFILILMIADFGLVSLSYINEIAGPFKEGIPNSITSIGEKSELNTLAHFIRYYDEVLTQSARNYAFTQNKVWEQRYKLAEPELDKLINNAIEKGDEESREIFRRIDNANKLLVAMEHASIEHANNGTPQGAILILESEQYWSQKNVYQKGLSEYAEKAGISYGKVLSKSTDVLHASVESVNESISDVYHIAAAFVIIALLISAILGILLSRSISIQINRIANVATQVAKGNLKVRADVDSKDELGALSESINEMINGLESYNKTIEEHAKQMELQIFEKTAELQNKISQEEITKKATLNIMEDIEESNRKLVDAQEKLNKNLEELKKLDYQKDQFISIAAHELKTPLTSIKGFSELLTKESVANNQELRKKYLDIIYKDARRLGSLLTNILELSRMDLGTMKVSAENANIPGLMNDVREQMDIIIKSKGLESSFDIGENLPPISIDRDKVIQVISNLINNAIHYTEKGTISIKVERKIAVVLFSVSDTGTGIPKEHWPKIFTRFYQVDSPLTRKIGGTGLGLSLSKGFVEAMGGRIWFESQENKGTTFFFTIPILKKEMKKEVDIFEELNKKGYKPVDEETKRKIIDEYITSKKSKETGIGDSNEKQKEPTAETGNIKSKKIEQSEIDIELLKKKGYITPLSEKVKDFFGTG